MHFATSGVQFSFDNNMYRQTDGVAMGSPLGPALANIFVGFYERQIGRRSWPDIYARFVDDVFSYFPNKSFCDRFYERLNSLHLALRFTREEEQEGSLPFMDVKVIRTTNGMATSVTGIQLESGAREETGRFRDVKRCVATEDRTRVSGISLLRHNR